MNQVIEQIQWCTNLKTLLLINSSHNLVEDGNFCRLTELKQLTTIVLYHMEKITFTSMANLFKQPHSKFLSKIVLTSCDGVNADVVKTIADNCRDLKVFGLHQFRCIEADVIKANDILYLASKCSKLEKLDLRYTHRSVGFSLVKVIEYLTRLRCFKYCDRCRKNIMMPVLSILKKNVKGFKIDVRVWLNSDNYICGITNNCY